MNTNLKHVVAFEIVRNLKKPIFWLTSLLLPILLIGYISLVSFTSYNTSNTIEANSDTSKFKLGLYDASGYLGINSEDTAENSSHTEALQNFIHFDTIEQGIEAVKTKEIDIFYSLPADFSENSKIQAYNKSSNANLFSNYDTPIRQLLTTTAATKVSAVDFAVLSGNFQVDTISFDSENNTSHPMDKFSKLIVPAIALVLFYILFCVFGNRLTTAMVEEKENRISEMILTSINPRDLIIGKIISLIALGFIQLAVLVIPAILLFIFAYHHGLVPAAITIDWDPQIIFSSFILLISSYFLFTALCVTISTLVPTAKDASSFAAILIILVMLPLFSINSFISTQPDSAIYFLSFFPPSAPISLMLRNAFGTLSTNEFIFGIINLLIWSMLSIKLSVYIFKRSALEFTSKISFKALLSKPRNTWKN